MWFQNKMKIANGVMISKVYIHVGGCTHTQTHTHTHTHTHDDDDGNNYHKD